MQPVDGRRDGVHHHPENVGIRARLSDESLVLLRDLDFLELDLLLLNRVHVHENVEEGRLRSWPAPLDAPQNPVEDDPLSRCDASREVVLDVGGQALRFLAAPESLWGFLDFNLLGVEVLGCLRQQLELRSARRAFAAALILVALEGLPERLAVLVLLQDGAAPQALEQGADDTWPHLRRFADEAFHGHVLSQMLRAQVANLHAPVPRQILDPQVDLKDVFPGGNEPMDCLLARRQDAQRMP